MARLVAVCREDDYKFLERQVPLVIDESLKMVMEFADVCAGCDGVGIKQKDLAVFRHKYNALTRDERLLALMVTSKDLFAALAQMVPCVGCRRSVERLFNQLMDSGHPSLEPLVVRENGMLSIMNPIDSKSLYALFNLHG
ncbi:PREDICTED: gametogenetin-binding protein 2-like, partial [Priapulus caudatus]|uniref:Gametogenetin-binding protein 2-like n=1 Tax=Priapulus caudatus TaxID=37621 RepID=A0ABM1EJP9_PRICU